MTAPDYGELCERLDSQNLLIGSNGVSLVARHRNPDGPEASTAIASLQAENEALRDALSPFAKAASIKLCGGDDYWSDEKSIQGTVIALHVTFGALRKAEVAVRDNQVGAQDNELQRLRAAIEGIADDYMTSTDHHPNYVLIPLVKFEELRAALQPKDQSND